MNIKIKVFNSDNRLGMIQTQYAMTLTTILVSKTYWWNILINETFRQIRCEFVDIVNIRLRMFAVCP